MTAAVLGLFCGAVQEIFETLNSRGFIPVSTSFERDNSGADPPPYRSVSLP